MTKNITLSPGNRETPHDAGRHGDGTQLDVVEYWAPLCCDCNAIWRYEHRLRIEGVNNVRA